MLRLLRAIGMISAMLCMAPALAETPKLLPVDEATLDQSLIVFRDSLRRAVERRDIDFVVAQASPRIQLSFDSDYGIETFREWLTGDQVLDGETYWLELERVLSLALGEASSNPGRACAPYISCRSRPARAFTYDIFVLTADALVYAAPDANAPVVARLSYGMLRIASNSFASIPVGATGLWFAVDLPAGGIGYVDLERPEYWMEGDYLAYFEKAGGRWRMTVFMGGFY